MCTSMKVVPYGAASVWWLTVTPNNPETGRLTWGPFSSPERAARIALILNGAGHVWRGQLRLTRTSEEDAGFLWMRAKEESGEGGHVACFLALWWEQVCAELQESVKDAWAIVTWDLAQPTGTFNVKEGTIDFFIDVTIQYLGTLEHDPLRTYLFHEDNCIAGHFVLLTPTEQLAVVHSDKEEEE